MSYSAPDQSDRLIELLKSKGYTVHTDGDGTPEFLQPPGLYRSARFWFCWTDGKVDVEPGEDQDTELAAWSSAMEHWFENAVIPAQSVGTTPATPEQIEEAREVHGSEEVNVDEDAVISEATDGHWISAWLWVEESA